VTRNFTFGAPPLIGPPNPRLALERYRELAADYDQRTATGEPYRRRTVEALALRTGDVVLDVGCGTGLNFAGLEEGIGAEGRLVAIDLSPDMLRGARRRVERHGWTNITLIEAAMEDAAVPGAADAALLCATHDILRSPPALERVLRHLRPGGQIVAGGPRFASRWRPDRVSMDLFTIQHNRDYVTTFEGFDRPWSHLDRLIPDLEVRDVLFGAGYIATGTRPAHLPRLAHASDDRGAVPSPAGRPGGARARRARS
jgi:demethylmenaquinone methyltransferase/2-methoxy-6-polyprenyl-1,4-benzoquinol methylase